MTKSDPKYGTILVPLDSSTFAEQALAPAASIARRAGAELCLATAIVIPALVPEGFEAVVAGDPAAKYMEDLADRVRASTGLRVVAEVLEAPSVLGALADHRERIEAGLVVMCTHGRGPVSRMWLGSEADAYLRHAEGPLLLVRPKDEEAPVDLTRELNVRRVLITHDGSSTSQAVMEPAVALGQLFGASYHVLRIVQPLPAMTSMFVSDTSAGMQEVLDEIKAAAERGTDEAVERLRSRGLEASGSVEVNTHVASGILSVAADGDFDVIAIATHGRGGLRRLALGSVADKVLRGAEVPVLTVRPTED